jgi:tetratricopeptide (TPR) repeat protein
VVNPVLRLAPALLLFGAPLAAQTAVADSLWGAARYREARDAYTAVLHEDPGSVRALFRLGILAAWDNRLDSALALFRDAREVEPKEPDVRLWEAKVLAWQGEYDAALVRYDSLIAELPARRNEARLARATTLVWAGREREADREYRQLIAENPNDVDALVGMGQLMFWQLRLVEADDYIRRALRVAPEERTGQDLMHQIRALRHPRLDLAVGILHDSDRNTAWWQTASTSLVVATGLRAFGSVGAYEASDPVRSGNRLSAEGGATWNTGNFAVTGALGVRRLSPELGNDRGLGTVRFNGSFRVVPGVSVGAGFARYSIDETAFLLLNALNISEFNAEVDVTLPHDMSLGLGGGLAKTSDHNQRRSLVVAATRQIAQRFTVGTYGRGLWYNFRGTGYFSPDQFLLGEVRGSYTMPVHRWQARLGAGAGVQQAGRGVSTEGEWHVDFRLARRWGTISEVALAGGITNSAISGVSGAFHYYTAALTARIGL